MDHFAMLTLHKQVVETVFHMAQWHQRHV